MLLAVFTTMRSRRLTIPLDDRELSLAVEGDTAVLELVAARPPRPARSERADPAHAGSADPGSAGPGSAGPAEPPDPTDVVDHAPPSPTESAVLTVGEPEPVRLRVPARALVAALRVAWADEHDLRCFEPWRDTTREGRWRGYEPYEDRGGWYDERYGGSSRWYDDLGDGDPDGYRDPTVVPFPRPVPPPRPSRAYQPWEQDEEEKLREMWLAAAPSTDRSTLVREIAEGLERSVGGIGPRLTVVGCDPARPGRRRFEPDDPDDPVADDPVADDPVADDPVADDPVADGHPADDQGERNGPAEPGGNGWPRRVEAHRDPQVS